MHTLNPGDVLGRKPASPKPSSRRISARLACAGNRRHDQHLTEDKLPTISAVFPPELFRVQLSRPEVIPHLARRVSATARAPTGHSRQQLGPRSRDLVGARACLSEGRYSGCATEHQRIPARLLSFRYRQKTCAAAGRGHPDRWQRKPGIHNLHSYAWGWHSLKPYDWAIKFELEADR